MINNPFQQTIELSKQELRKQMNQKLNMMLKKKNIQTSKAIETHKNKPQKSQIKIQQKKIEKKQLEIIKQKDEDELQIEKNDKNQKHKLIKKQQKKQSRTMRKAAGEVWQDKTMEDWPQNGYRIFVGNLGKQVDDNILGSVFQRYKSFQMARVIKDRRTGCTRGYGFVSLANPQDFLDALKQMNGKHIGNRPCKLTKSNYKERDLNSERNQYLPSDFKKNSQKETHKICIDYKYVSPY